MKYILHKLQHSMIIAGLLGLLATSALGAAKNTNNGNGNGHGNKKAASGHGFVCPEVKNSADFIIDEHKPTVGLFYSDSCSMCDIIKKPFNAFVQAHQGELNCVTLNGDLPSLQNLMSLYGIEGFPTIVVIHKLVGANPDAKSFERSLSRMTGLSSPSGATHIEVVENTLIKPEEKPALQGSAAKDQNPEGFIPPQSEELMEEIEDQYDFKPTDTPLSVTPEEIAPVFEEGNLVPNKPSNDVMP